MSLKRSVRARRRRRRRGEDIAPPEPVLAASARQAQHLGPHYGDGPVRPLTPRQPALEATLAPTHGAGAAHDRSAFGQTVRLQGRTDATFDGGRFRVENVRVRSAERCAECGGGERIHVTGVLVATYRVRTRVTLPDASDFSGLTRCQQQRVRNAIANVLRPHEQQHVTEFERYNGVTRTPFDLTLCRNEFDGAIQSMFEDEERARRDAAQAASDALDPFHFDVDLDCGERASQETTPETGAPTPAGEQPASEVESAEAETARAEETA